MKDCSLDILPLNAPFFYICLQTHKIDPSCHYLRLKVWIDNQMLFYVPKLEEDISDLVRNHTPKHCCIYMKRISKFWTVTYTHSK